MIRKSWWHRIQFFLVGTLIIVLLQSCTGIWKQPPQVQRSQSVPSECRIIQHERGSSCIPLHPQRVIVMDQESLEILVALGFEPLAAATSNRVGNKLSIFQDKIEINAIADLGKESQPNLEKIVQLKPDLILGMFINAPLYPLLAQIAPTVSVEYSQTGWKKTLQQVAEMLDRTAKANELLTAYQNRIEWLRSQLTEKIGKLEISGMRFYTDAHLTQFLNQNSFTISVLEELKVLSIPEFQRQQVQIPNSDYGYVNVSLERIDWLDADAIFVALDPGAEASLQLYSDSPLWQTLNVVKQHRVYLVDSGYWIFGNILSANAILDDVFQHLISANQN